MYNPLPPKQHSGSNATLAGMGVLKTSSSCFLQSVLLVNRIFPPFGGPTPVHTRSYTLPVR